MTAHVKDLEAEIRRLKKEAGAWRKVAHGRRGLLACYRIGLFHNADAALRKIENGTDALRKLGINNP